jgi:transposase
LRRGHDERSGSLFSYVDLEARVPKDHPLRAIRRIVDAALVDLAPAFAALYAPVGRPSIPPERLVRGRCCSRRSTHCAPSAS